MLLSLARPSALALTLLLMTDGAPAQESVPSEKPAASTDSPVPATNPSAVESPKAPAKNPDAPATSGPPSIPVPVVPGAGPFPPLPMAPGGFPPPPNLPFAPPGGFPPLPGPPAGLPGAPPVPGPGTGPPPETHSAIFRYYDKNGDQILSPEELAKVPGPIREWMSKQKIDVTAGLRREDFDLAAPKLVDHLRVRTAETILAPSPLPAPGSQPPPSGSATSRNSRGGSSEFRGLDLDQDAQLSFREWRAGKRLAADFAPRDLNGDGMVTSAEFDQTKGLAASGPTAPGTAVSARPLPPGATPPPGIPAPPNIPLPPGVPAPPGISAPPGMVPAAPSSVSALGTAASRQTFDQLDRNKDGMINPDEWGNSRRVGPGFKEKGIDISKNMSQADFHANYAKAFAPK